MKLSEEIRGIQDGGNTAKLLGDDILESWYQRARQLEMENEHISGATQEALVKLRWVVKKLEKTGGGGLSKLITP